MNVMTVRDTLSNCDVPTFQISLTYLERQTSYGPDYPLFDLRVKGQGQKNVMIYPTHRLMAMHPYIK